MALAALASLRAARPGGTSASLPRPTNPLNLSVYVNDSRVSVSPATVGAGPVMFIVTNQASARRGAGHLPRSRPPLANTAPINPQGTTQVSVDFKPGEYTHHHRLTGPHRRPALQPSPIRPASIHIGRERDSSSNSLLQP